MTHQTNGRTSDAPGYWKPVIHQAIGGTSDPPDHSIDTNDTSDQWQVQRHTKHMARLVTNQASGRTSGRTSDGLGQVKDHWQIRIVEGPEVNQRSGKTSGTPGK